MLQALVKELKAMPELLQSTHPSLQNQFSWSWTSHVIRNILKRMLEWWSPVCLWLMQVFGMAGVAEQKAWLGWCLDMTLPSWELAQQPPAGGGGT